MGTRVVLIWLGVSCMAAAVGSCDVATDPLGYEDFRKAEGEGEFGVWVHSGLYNRTYYLHEPPNLQEGEKRPLLIFLHGNGGTGRGLHAGLQADQATDSAGFITVYPDGMEGSWSVGCNDCTPAEALKTDDVTFLQTLARHLSEHIPVDTMRVYVVGYSQGGSLAHLFGCRASTPPAGIAGVGSLAFRSIEVGCDPSRAFPVVVVHGTGDPVVFYTGYGGEAPLQPVLETLQMWAGIWGCDPVPTSLELPDTVEDFTTVTEFRYEGCRTGASVVHYRVNEGGHTWPGPTGPWSHLLGLHNRDLDATRAILAEFTGVTPP